MNRTTCFSFILAVVMACMASAAAAAECSGAWRVLPNYRGGAGGPCVAIGLNTH